MNVEPIQVAEKKQKQASCEEIMTEPLRDSVYAAMKNYFKHLNGYGTCDLYQMVLTEVEPPLLESVMEYTKGNQTRAAEVLGISRSTLRKKLAIYELD